MEYIELNEGTHLYYCDYNTIINRDLKDRFLQQGEKRKVPFRYQPHDAACLREKVRHLDQVIFQASLDCNLRCKYCVFGGTYTFQRSHVPGKMSFDIAARGLDYLYDILKDRRKKEFVVSFYGGEPLLNFNMIRKTVDYARKKFEGWKLRLVMTSNLTLLTDEMIKYLIGENFHVSVSIDGPRENHDAKRVFADGRGTFDTVMKNLEKIRAADGAYYKENIDLLIVFSSDLSFKKMYEFFRDHPLLNSLSTRFSNVDKYDTNYYEQFPYDPHALQEEVDAVHEVIKGKMKRGEELLPIENAISVTLTRILNYLKTRDSFDCGNTCMFDDKLFIDTEGRFHVCEKVNQQFSYGDVWQGFNFQRMTQILDDFCAVMEKECRDCFYRHLCFRCFVHMAKDGEFRVNRDLCEDRKKYIRNSLERRIRFAKEGVFKDTEKESQ